MYKLLQYCTTFSFIIFSAVSEAIEHNFKKPECPEPVKLTFDPRLLDDFLVNPPYLRASKSQLHVDLEDANLTTPQLIHKYGYPVEIHDVTTEDGYILELHRIPHGAQCGSGEPKRVIYLQHGLLGDSSNYIFNGVNHSLGYVLSDACYDVWMGNARGNRYSRRHASLDYSNPQDKPKYWNFTFHEMGIYDVPATIDYILEETGSKDLYYVGHSMGTTMFWIAMSEKPEYNSKIKLMSALAPVAYISHMKSALALLAPIIDEIETLAHCVGAYEITPSENYVWLMGLDQLCSIENPAHSFCSTLVFLLGGYDPEELDEEMTPVMLGHFPSGSSIKTLLHYGQGLNKDAFRKYSYGREKNLKIYGQEEPPKYDISKITAPVSLYWAQNDILTTPVDVEKLSKELPNLVRNFEVNHSSFSHLDFAIAINADKLLNQPLMDFMDEFKGSPPEDEGSKGSACNIKAIRTFYLLLPIFYIFHLA